MDEKNILENIGEPMDDDMLALISAFKDAAAVLNDEDVNPSDVLASLELPTPVPMEREKCEQIDLGTQDDGNISSALCSLAKSLERIVEYIGSTSEGDRRQLLAEEEKIQDLYRATLARTETPSERTRRELIERQITMMQDTGECVLRAMRIEYENGNVTFEKYIKAVNEYEEEMSDRISGMLDNL